MVVWVMCRFLLYLGSPIHLSSLITAPENSLIRQSYDSQERTEPLNGDGFGVAWYPPDRLEVATLFRSMTPAWSNQNLRHLSAAVRSPCVMAHVRAASAGMGVVETNTHPFVNGSFAFMHNGRLGGFRRRRRALLAELDARQFNLIQGNTDSECMFAHALQELQQEAVVNAATMAAALQRAISRVIDRGDAKHPRRHSHINAVLSNGREAVVCRFTDGEGKQAPSLHIHTGKLYTEREGKIELVEADEDEHAVIVSSEALTGDPSWRRVPNNSMVSIDAQRDVTITSITI